MQNKEMLGEQHLLFSEIWENLILLLTSPPSWGELSTGLSLSICEGKLLNYKVCRSPPPSLRQRALTAGVTHVVTWKEERTLYVMEGVLYPGRVPKPSGQLRALIPAGLPDRTVGTESSSHPVHNP